MYRGSMQDCGGESRRKEPLARSRCRLVDNMLVDIQEMGSNDMNWINLAQDRDHWHAVGSIICKEVFDWVRNY
jgi:hypothetical protein